MNEQEFAHKVATITHKLYALADMQRRGTGFYFLPLNHGRIDGLLLSTVAGQQMSLKKEKLLGELVALYDTRKECNLLCPQGTQRTP